MPNFNFGEWKFNFGEGTGKLGDSNVIYLKDIISESDVFLKQGVSKPILTRSAIGKLMRHFKIYEKDFKTETTLFNSQDILMVKMYLGIRDDENTTFVGNGEVSAANTDGIGLLFPLAVATKRARSRGLLDFLGIDAFSEEESKDFVRLDSDSEERVNELSELLMKKTLQRIAANINKALVDVDKETIKNYIKFILDKEDISLANLTAEDLVSVITGFTILKYTNAETFFEIVGNIKKDNNAKEETANS